MLLSQLSHIKLFSAFLLIYESNLVSLHLLLMLLDLDLLHHLNSFFLPLAAFLSLFSQFLSQILPSNVPLCLILLLLISLLLLCLIGLRLEALLFVDLGTACELVPHPASALHEIFVLHLL